MRLILIRYDVPAETVPFPWGDAPHHKEGKIEVWEGCGIQKNYAALKDI